MLEKIKNLFQLENIPNQELVNYIIIYLRKSRKDSEFSQSESIAKTLERHETILQDWAYNIFNAKIPPQNIYKEVVSGDTISDRPQMQKVLQLIEQEHIKAVLCIEIERLARGNSIDQGIIAQKFKVTQTKILTPTKIFDLDDEFDLSYFEDGLHQARKFLLYTKKILNRGREQSSKEGKFVGSKPPFGYTKQKLKNEKGFILVKNSDNIIVRKLFDLYLYENLTPNQIAQKLNLLGYHPPSNPFWNSNIVHRIISRCEVYAGYIQWGKRKIIPKYINGQIINTRPLNKNCLIVKGRHEATITLSEYKQIKAKLKTQTKNTTPHQYELQNSFTNLIKCHFCHHNMTKRSYSKTKNSPPTLICRTPSCPNIATNFNIVEKYLITYLTQKLKNYSKILTTYQPNNEPPNQTLIKEKKALSKKITTLNNQKLKCCELLETNIYNQSTYKQRITELNNALKTTTNSLNIINQELKSLNSSNYLKKVPNLNNWLKLYNLASPTQKNALLSTLITQIDYKKTTKGSRWYPNKAQEFTLEIKFKINF